MTLLDKAIDAAYDKFEPTGGRGKYNWEAFKAGYEAAELVMPKWTYLPELPAVKGWYDVTTTKTGARSVIQSFFNGKEFEDRCIVAWMPLPEPAK